jgi:hypothetical protein
MTDEDHPSRKDTDLTRRNNDNHKHLKLVEVCNVRVLSSSLGTLAQHLGGLIATDSPTPLTALLLVFVRAARQQNNQYEPRKENISL